MLRLSLILYYLEETGPGKCTAFLKTLLQEKIFTGCFRKNRGGTVWLKKYHYQESAT
jgi:hypothetical protein